MYIGINPTRNSIQWVADLTGFVQSNIRKTVYTN